jgi:hypothetical protein
MQKYKILMDGATITSGYFAAVDYPMLEHQAEFIRNRVKDGVIVELVTWVPNR